MTAGCRSPSSLLGATTASESRSPTTRTPTRRDLVHDIASHRRNPIQRPLRGLHTRFVPSGFPPAHERRGPEVDDPALHRRTKPFGAKGGVECTDGFDLRHRHRSVRHFRLQGQRPGPQARQLLERAEDHQSWSDSSRTITVTLAGPISSAQRAISRSCRCRLQKVGVHPPSEPVELALEKFVVGREHPALDILLPLGRQDLREGPEGDDHMDSRARIEIVDDGRMASGGASAKNSLLSTTRFAFEPRTSSERRCQCVHRSGRSFGVEARPARDGVDRRVSNGVVVRRNGHPAPRWPRAPRGTTPGRSGRRLRRPDVDEPTCRSAGASDSRSAIGLHSPPDSRSSVMVRIARCTDRERRPEALRRRPRASRPATAGLAPARRRHAEPRMRIAPASRWSATELDGRRSASILTSARPPASSRRADARREEDAQAQGRRDTRARAGSSGLVPATSSCRWRRGRRERTGRRSPDPPDARSPSPMSWTPPRSAGTPTPAARSAPPRDPARDPSCAGRPP